MQLPNAIKNIALPNKAIYQQIDNDFSVSQNVSLNKMIRAILAFVFSTKLKKVSFHLFDSTFVESKCPKQSLSFFNFMNMLKANKCLMGKRNLNLNRLIDSNSKVDISLSKLFAMTS